MKFIAFIIIAFAPLSCSVGSNGKNQKDDPRRNYLDEYDAAPAWGKINEKDWRFVSGKVFFSDKKNDKSNLIQIELYSDQVSNPCQTSSYSVKRTVAIPTKLEIQETVLDDEKRDSWIYYFDMDSRPDDRTLYVKKGKFSIDEISETTIKGRVNTFKNRENFVTGTFEVTRCPREIKEDSKSND